MHEMIFRLKRGYWRALLFAKPLAELIDERLTPARFDILYLLSRAVDGHRLPMQDIILRLGWSKSTISKLVKRMEQLGLVERRTAHWDARCKVVALTHDGHDVIARAVRAFLHADPLRDELESIRRDKHGDGVPFLRRTRRAVHVVARFFHDRSTHAYSLKRPRDAEIAAEVATHERVGTVLRLFEEARAKRDGTPRKTTAPPAGDDAASRSA